MNNLAPLDKVDVIIDQAIKADNPDIVFHHIRELEQAKETIDNIKSKFIFRLDQNWREFSISGTESLYTQADASLGMHPHTVDRYITMWKHQDLLPETLKERPVREKFVITKAIAQGHEFSDKDWEKLERTNTKAEVDAALRDIKGEPPRKGSLQAYVSVDGTLYGWMNGRRGDAGYLDINSDDPIAQKLIKRIMDNAGVLRK